MRAGVRAAVGVALCVVVAALLRLPHLGWDGGYSLHPDERGIIFVAESLAWPGDLNPYRGPAGERRAYAYGHLPLYAITAMERAGCALMCGEALRFERLQYTARLLSALADLGTVVLAGMVAFRLAGWQAAPFAAGMVALSPLHIQNATYGTVDSPLAFFCTLALLLMLRREPSRGWAAAAGSACGLALSVKISAAVLVLPLMLAYRQRAGWALGGLGAAFVLSSPYALLDAPAFLTNLSTQAAVTAGRLEVWFTVQYEGTLPVVYTLGQLGHWGMGWAALTLCGVGLLSLSVEQWREQRVLLVWVWAGLLTASVGLVKFPRYFLMVSPAFFVVGALWWSQRGGKLRALLAGVILMGLGVRAAALDGMYNHPHPWVAASAWAYETLPPGTTLLSEGRDDALPLAFEREGLLRGALYETATVPIWEGDAADIAGVLAEGDVLIISTRRGYGSHSAAAGYYAALFTGDLGYTLTRTFDRHPTAGPVAFADAPCAGTTLDCPAPDVDVPFVYRTRLDESFVVYDQPRVLVFVNEAHLPADTLHEHIMRAAP